MAIVDRLLRDNLDENGALLRQDCSRSIDHRLT